MRDDPSPCFGRKIEEVKAAAKLLEKECEGDDGVNKEEEERGAAGHPLGAHRTSS